MRLEGGFYGAHLDGEGCFGLESARMAGGSRCDRLYEGTSVGGEGAEFVGVGVVLLVAFLFVCALLLGVDDLGRVRRTLHQQRARPPRLQINLLHHIPFLLTHTLIRQCKRVI